MTDATDLSLDALEQQENEFVFSGFALMDAWRLGTWLVEAAKARGYPVVVDICRPGFVLFRSALPGSTPDQQEWATRKAAVALRMETSSRLFAARVSARGVDPAAIGWLNDQYAITGGSVPIRVADTGVVAAATVSGLSSTRDHDFVVEGLREALGGHGARS